MVVDVERFGDPSRTDLHRLAVRDGLYKALTQAFRKSRIAWAKCVSEDRGDGALILVPPDVPKTRLVISLPAGLVAAINRHNAGCAEQERMRLRAALHAGEIRHDSHGVTGAAINHAFRLLEAPALRSALEASSGVLAVIVSDWLFNEVVRHDPAAAPTSYWQVQLAVKETATVGWIRWPDPVDALGTPAVTALHAIERHAQAVSTRSDPPSESDFLTRYHRHVTEYHGMLEPPDSGRRRRVPIADLYVPPTIVKIHCGTSQLPPHEVTLQQFSEEIDRTVLLGDPGSGKTTAVQVLMHHQATHPRGRVPFMVALREFASALTPRRSVAGHIRDKLETFYQCPEPPGTVERLLLSGKALVIFDGLDELADTTLRAEVAAIIERFCAEYPPTRVLVTSRLIGYDQARLDDRQFTCYRLGSFDGNQITDYVRKWFAQEHELSPAEADRRAAAFLAESKRVPDLRVNPLMLALMCLLYRGESSIPRNRLDGHEQCATLMFRRWDVPRHIHAQLRARSQVNVAEKAPVLPGWLFANNINVTEEYSSSPKTERRIVTAHSYG